MKSKITILTLFIVLGFYSLQAQVSEEWIARYDGPGNSNDYASAMAVDGSGNVYVTGRGKGSDPGQGYVTIKYNTSGVQQWIQIYQGPGNNDVPTSIAVDGSGNVYVTGDSYSSVTWYDYATIKYNSSGVQQWVQRYNGLTVYAEDRATSLAVDDSENVYVTGSSEGVFTTIKYNLSGVQQWIQRDNDGNGPQSIAIDGSGNIYVAGSSWGINTHEDYVTVKYNSTGVKQWVQRYNGSSNNNDAVNSLAVDDSENVYVTGRSLGRDTYYDYVTIKYNSSGAQQWVQRYNGPGNGGDYAASVAVYGSGNVYVFGRSDGDYATIKYNSFGVQQWIQRYTGPGDRYNPFTLTIDGSENIYVTGPTYDSLTSNNYGTIKYNSSGILQWVQIYNGPADGGDGATSIAVDGSGNVYVTGTSEGKGTGYDFTTIKYSQLTRISQTYTSIPEKFSLSQNYPNPFNPVTKINYELRITNYVSLNVYDVLGNEVFVLVNEKQNAGTYSVEWDAGNYPSGVYFYKLLVDGNIFDTKRMMLLK